jgi:DNA polymerase-3 subunit delta
MKLTYFQAEAHLAKKLSPLYLVSGDELLLKQDIMQWIRKAAKHAGFDERIRLAPEGEGEQLYSLLYARSLLAEKRLLELDFRESSPNKNISKILQEYAENPAADTIVIIDTAKMDAKFAKSALAKACEKSGTLITLWPIPREQLPEWIQKRAHKYKLQIQPDAANLLADYVEGNLIAAAQTLEKLYLLKLQQPVDADIIQNILTDESRYTIFDFTDSLIAGNKTRALHILDSLKEEGTEPVLILWGITRELRLLADYAKQVQQGLTPEQIFQQQRILPRKQTAVRRFLSKFKAADCLQLLKHAAEIDKVMKGAVKGDSFEALEMFCLRTCYN